MSVEKYIPAFESGVLTKESIPYTQIANKPLQECTNAEALGMWCYLQSRPPEWILSPQELQNHFKMGKNKVYELLNFLIETHLLKRVKITKKDGTFLSTIYTVLNGTNFINNQQPDPLPCLPDVDYPDMDNRDTINKRVKINKRRKTKIKDFFGKKRKPETVFPDELKPSPNNYEFCAKNKLDCELEFSKFRERCLAKDIRYISWKAAFNNWLLNALQFRKEREENQNVRLQKSNGFVESTQPTLEAYKKYQHQTGQLGISSDISD